MLWMIEPHALENFMRTFVLQVQATNPLSIEQIESVDSVISQCDWGTFAGPVADASRIGLPITQVGDTAVVSIAGPMIKGPAWFRLFGFAVTPLIRGALASAVADEDISQIVLRIDSPGGTVDGTAELADDIRKAAKAKPVIAQSGGTIASAAYWAASQAQSIHAGRMDLVGSIGVRLMMYDFSEAFREAGIKPIVVDTGPFKSTGAMGTEVTAEQKQYLTDIVEAQFAEFRSAVMIGRGMNDEQFNAVSDGRVFTAEDSLNMGLIDGIQPIEQTLAAFRSKASSRRKTRARLELSRKSA